MAQNTILDSKAEELARILKHEVRNELIRARLNHWIGMALVVLAILSSAFAGLGGLARLLGPPTVGAIALIPGAFALLSTTIKFDGRAMWHYRKKRELDALWRRLKFEMSTPPTADQIALVSATRTEIGRKLDDEWEKEFALGWSWTHPKSEQIR